MSRMIRENNRTRSKRDNNSFFSRNKNKWDNKGMRRVRTYIYKNRKPPVPGSYKKLNKYAPKTYIKQRELRAGFGLIGIVPTFNISLLKRKTTITGNENSDNSQ